MAFVIWGPGDGLDSHQEGHVSAVSCEAAEAFLRNGLRADQELRIISCEPVGEENSG